MTWQQKAEQLRFTEKKSWTEIYRAIQAEYGNIKDETIRTHLRNCPEYKNQSQNAVIENPREIIISMLSKGAKLQDIVKRTGQSERVTAAMIDDFKDQGYNIEHNRNGQYILSKTYDDSIPNVVNSDWSGDKIIRFGLMGDPQINSKYTQITHLHTMYDVYRREGITKVYNTGDIDEGEEMRPGHKYECYNQGADDHVNEIVKVYPKRDGIETSFITGNHDHSIIKRSGTDIGYQIAAKRPDMKYLGLSAAVICLTPNCTLELRHPIDGTAYAISYKTQKMIEALSGGEKPNILAVGHYHKAEYIFYRNIHCFQTGCFQAQTPWMRGKQIAAMMGGWIVEIHVNDEGNITRIRQDFFPFYRAIKDDYLNFK